MPAGTAVMETFKNLIRHGKHGKDQPRAGDRTSPSQTTAAHAQGTSSNPPREQRRAEREVHREVQQDTQQCEVHGQKDNRFGHTAEQIVREEREAKNKMPQYKGLERFKLLDKMGDGAFSNVYKAVDLTTSQKVAVKVVRKFELNSTQARKHLNPQFKKRPRVTERANILKEVQIMRGISHPSVVKLISFSESEEHYFLVLELMEGGELFHQIVKLTYFSENLARHVILQVAHGIHYLHEERGVVHRDIKPENLLFDRIPIIPSKQPISRPYDEEKEDEGEFLPGVGGGGIGRVKIADFGLSKVVWNEETMTPCGTVGYTAPEIVKDERYSKSVDMWAMGCVLYTLLCGFPPFYDESINVLTEKVARGYYTFLSPWWDDISASAKDLITHLLCVDPAQRYTIDEFLAHPWCSESPAPLPEPTPDTLAPPTRNNMPIDSPLLMEVRGRGGREGRSPGLATLKEAFDVTYAVHRMEEEGARRRAYNGPGGAGVRGFLGGLNEDDENEVENDAAVVEDARKKQQASKAQPQQRHYAAGGADRRQAEAALYDGRAGQRDRGGGNKRRQNAGNSFELDINNATLLGRRHKKAEPSPLGRAPIIPEEVDPGSPMRL
ncbi:Pkinase-domain-containing protein [Dacryopinax primogenitus]|uniref:Pkinase-domain-containing protein n=1 Tax=Dacryopinax primogenitus (strain DJM 731) TaxID=1858805 RepID=M5GCK6_DACPD|nr:Pkinase-domain-containing protein [Dacryopinax primogenitus]EJU06270.1 Pkinase-domain-containing protein [Dacryopinax primogenitus]